jgi:hypothetical protein
MKKIPWLLAFISASNFLLAQNVGIGVTNPLTKLHIKGGLLLDSTNGGTPVSGAGTRLMWVPAKEAFRAGRVAANNWNDDSIGLGSFALGWDAKAKGLHAFAIGALSSATADYSMALGAETKASGQFSTAMGFGTNASAAYSFAWGFRTRATGDVSTALGNLSQASGFTSTAMGYGTQAIGDYGSFSTGELTKAIGKSSSAFGYNSKAAGYATVVFGVGTMSKPYSGTVIGTYNDSADAVNQQAIDPLNRLFEIGNGTDYNTRRNAMTVLQNGNVGIGTTTPQSFLHVKNGSVLFDSTVGDVPISGAGTRMMWIPGKKAFRAGQVVGTNWDDLNIGVGSVAFGYDCKASGQYSVSTGYESIASGPYSTSIGTQNVASGFLSIAMGWATTTSGTNSTAMGFSTKALGDYSTATGNATVARGYNSTASGLSTVSKAFAGTVFGTFNDSTNAASSVAFDPANRIFQIGNGTANNTRSNAMTVLQNGKIGIGILNPVDILEVADRMRLFSGPAGTAGIWLNKNNNVGPAGFIGTYVDDNYIGIYGHNGAGWQFFMNTATGNVGIGTDAPSQKLHVNGNICYTGSIAACSDIRYKKNIRPLNNVLIKVLALHGIFYNWNKENFKDKAFTDETQIGFSAQEIEKLFPELVQTDAKGYKAVDYSRLTPVLVEAVKEQQKQIDDQAKKIEWLLKEMQVLKEKANK